MVALDHQRIGCGFRELHARARGPFGRDVFVNNNAVIFDAQKPGILVFLPLASKRGARNHR